MYQHNILRVIVILSIKYYFPLCEAYRFKSGWYERIGQSEYFKMQKKSLDIKVPETEHVCPVTILKRHRPQFGHMINGSFVEVQQDMENNFEATFVECKNGHHRPPCHGINTIIYSSECVTLYEWREAFVRLPQSDVNFILSKIKHIRIHYNVDYLRSPLMRHRLCSKKIIPIACQCRLIRKLQPFARRLVKYLAQ